MKWMEPKAIKNPEAEANLEIIIFRFDVSTCDTSRFFRLSSVENCACKHGKQLENLVTFGSSEVNLCVGMHSKE